LTTPGSFDLSRAEVAKAYARWAPFYDAICGPVFLIGRRAAADAACRVGGLILEVGVGTGLSFPDYGDGTAVIGIDLSDAMISKAHERLGSGHYPHVKSLLAMDATALAFRDASFDCVVLQFVITLTADPERVLSECARVVRPGGEIVLVNHFYSEKGLAAAIERWCAGPSRKLGLRPEFEFSRLVTWAHRHGSIELVERRPLKPLGVYTLVRFRRCDGRIQPANRGAAAATAQI